MGRSVSGQSEDGTLLVSTGAFRWIIELSLTNWFELIVGSGDQKERSTVDVCVCLCASTGTILKPALNTNIFVHFHFAVKMARSATKLSEPVMLKFEKSCAKFHMHYPKRSAHLGKGFGKVSATPLQTFRLYVMRQESIAPWFNCMMTRACNSQFVGACVVQAQRRHPKAK